MSLAGCNAEIEQGATISAGVGALAIDGYALDIQATLTIPATCGALVLDGHNVSVQTGGTPIALLQSVQYHNSL